MRNECLDEPVRDEGEHGGGHGGLVRVWAGGHWRLLLIRPLYARRLWVSKSVLKGLSHEMDLAFDDMYG
jgi:hypothetical protein